MPEHAPPQSRSPLPTSGGRPLPDGLRQEMEQSLGEDFRSVRIHEGEHAQSIGAVAATQGERVHFAPGRFDPDSQAGKRLVAHELAHVKQQRQGRVATPDHDGVPINASAELEAEADRAADAAVIG